MPERRRSIALGALMAALAAAATWHVLRPAAASTAPAAPADASPPPVAAAGEFRPTAAQLHTLTVETVRRASFEDSIVTDGRIGANAEHATPVLPALSGRVSQVLVHAGERVARGQVLARVEAAEFAQAAADLRGSTAQLELARSTEQRRRSLHEARGASLQEVEQGEADLAAAQATNTAARMHLLSLGASAADIDRLSAPGKEPSGGSVALLRAPIAGIVTDRQIAPGQFLQAGAGVAPFTVSDASSVWLWANVRESEAARVHVGQQVEAELVAIPGCHLQGRLDFVAAAIDTGSHRLTVHATLDNRDGSLKPEMLATVRIHLGDTRTSPAVPESAIVHDGDSARVWVVGSGGDISARAVTLGRLSAKTIEVLTGLTAGERIVTRGALFVDTAAGQAP